MQEMHHFLGTALKTSLMPMDAGGCTAHFGSGNHKIDSGGGHPLLETDGMGHIIGKHMTLNGL